MSESLFDKIGGTVAVETAVDIFYRKVLEDKSINHFFDNTNMDAQRAKQMAFLTMAFGGPNNYSGKELRDAHAPLVQLGLNENHFNAVAGHLMATLKELDVPNHLIQEVMDITTSTHDDILGL